jgi:cytochrome c oxidase subunit 1/cytochrome c oxidase subunit I+III
MIGMPRRVYTYPDLPWYGALNMISTVSAFIMGIAVLYLAYIIIKCRKSGQPAPADPWDGFTLEWIASSPPLLKNFDEVPVVNSRQPLWDLKYPELADITPD